MLGSGSFRTSVAASGAAAAPCHHRSPVHVFLAALLPRVFAEGAIIRCQATPAVVLVRRTANAHAPAGCRGH